jgi:hypothetical protein
VGDRVLEQAEGKGVDEAAVGLRQQPGAEKPGGQRRPAKPQQGARCDVFVDAGAARAALVRGGRGHGRGLHRIEVVQQADPEHAGDDVQPAVPVLAKVAALKVSAAVDQAAIRSRARIR